MTATLQLLAGSPLGEPGYVDAVGSNARFNSPQGMCLYGEDDEYLLICDYGNYALRLVEIETAEVSTLFDFRATSRYQEGAAPYAGRPVAVAVNEVGDIFVSLWGDGPAANSENGIAHLRWDDGEVIAAFHPIATGVRPGAVAANQVGAKFKSHVGDWLSGWWSFALTPAAAVSTGVMVWSSYTVQVTTDPLDDPPYGSMWEPPKFTPSVICDGGAGLQMWHRDGAFANDGGLLILPAIEGAGDGVFIAIHDGVYPSSRGISAQSVLHGRPYWQASRQPCNYGLIPPDAATRTLRRFEFDTGLGIKTLTHGPINPITGLPTLLGAIRNGSGLLLYVDWDEWNPANPFPSSGLVETGVQGRNVWAHAYRAADDLTMFSVCPNNVGESGFTRDTPYNTITHLSQSGGGWHTRIYRH